MNKQTEALKMAIEALSQDEGWFEPEAAIQACKEALEQPAQEYLTRAQQVIRANNSAQEPVMIEDCNAARQIKEWHEKNTHPAPSWQGLSDDEIDELPFYDYMTQEEINNVVHAIEDKLKEKNER